MTSDDRLWFEQQIGEMQKALYNVAYCIVKNSSDAEDAVCDALLSAWQDFPKLHDRSYFRAWLMKILKFRSYDILRRNRKYAEYDDRLLNYSRNDAVDDLEVIESAERERSVRNAISQLPDEQRLCVTLFYMEDYSIKEISKIMQCTEGTTKSRLSRAREKLKKLLEGGEYDA